MRCMHCGKPLPLLRKWTGGEFCSEEHRQAYAQDQAKLALSRLVDEQQAIHAGKRPRRRGIALPLPEDQQQRQAPAPAVALSGAAMAAAPPKRRQALPLPKQNSNVRVSQPGDPAFSSKLYVTGPRPQRDGIRIHLKWDAVLDISAFPHALPHRDARIPACRVPSSARLAMDAWIPATRPGASERQRHEEPWTPATAEFRRPSHKFELIRDRAEQLQRSIENALETGTVPFARLASLPVNGHYRNWTAPIRMTRDSSLDITPAIPPTVGLRVDRGYGSPSYAPLVRGNRLLGRPRIGTKRLASLPVEPRFPLAQPDVPLRPVGSRVTLTTADKVHMDLQGATRSGSRVVALTAEPAYPSIRPGSPDLDLIGALRLLSLAQRVPMIASLGVRSASTSPRGGAGFEFPAPFLLPPKPPVPAAPVFRAEMEGVLALSLAPKRGVESSRLMGPSHSHIEFGAPGTLMPIPPLQTVTDWLPLAGKAFPLAYEVPQEKLAAKVHRGFPFDEDLTPQTPARPASRLAPRGRGLALVGDKLFRLNYDNIVPHDSKTDPRPSLDLFRTKAEATLPKFNLRLRNTFASEFEEADPMDDLPVWKRPLVQAGTIWSNLHAVPKWGGIATAAVLLGVLIIPGPSTSVSASSPAIVPSQTGGLSGFQRTLLSRAAISLTDDFRAGLADWEGNGEWARSWSYDAAGFVRTGTLALYTPSLDLTDYRLEFLGQIERGGMSWAVRASDLYNYQAVKIELRDEGGPLPAAYVIRYPVIEGKAGEALERRLPLQVTHDTLYRVLMEVRGNNYVLSVQGNIVHSWSEPRLRHGGVGFFSAKGELARLRWIGVWHQYDTLGRLCAFLAPYSLNERERSGGQ